MKKKFEVQARLMKSLSKILIQIKASCIILLAFGFQAYAGSNLTYSQTVKLEIHLKNASLEQVIWTMEKQSDFNFFYSNSEVKSVKGLDIDLKDATAEDVLDLCLEGTGLTHEIVNKTIIIKAEAKVASPKTVSVSQNAQQTKQISGSVTDAQGRTLPGATVMVKGTTIGVISDNDGKYVLSVPLTAKVLVFSFVGMQSQEFAIGNSNVYNVKLAESETGIDEVVIVGYGAQKKQSVVGSIATVSEKELKRRGGVYNLGQAISGQMAGITVMEISGEPGRNEPEIVIRGMSTWNGSAPLILVDGIERRMSDVDVNDVDNISVLKDASATAVFGVKGANGVILITTKRGQQGKAQLTISANTGWKSLSKTNDMIDAYEAQSWRNKAIEYEVPARNTSWGYYTPYEQLIRSKRPQVEPYSYLYPNVDWNEVLFKNFARNQRYNLNLSGGNDFVRYFASVGYLQEGDLFDTHYNESKGYKPEYSYQRMNFRGNIDINLTKTTVLSSNLSGYYGTRKSPAGDFNGDGTSHIFGGYMDLAPDAFPVKYPSGRYGLEIGSSNMSNPVAIMQESGVDLFNRRQLSTDTKLVQKLDFITKGLSFAANISYDTFITTNGPSISDFGNQGQALYEQINPSILDAKTPQDILNATQYAGSTGTTGVNDFDLFLRPWTVDPETVSTTGRALERSLFYQASVNYARTFGKHDVSGLFLVNRRQDTYGSDFSNFREDWVGRVTYNYNNRYFGEFNGAYNGSEKFSPKYRFGFFPSMALGWMVSDEEFMKQFTWLSKFKIRGSIGQVGSDAGIPRWGYVGSWNYTGNSSWFYNSNGTIAASPYKNYYEGTIPNENIRWETALKRNIGAEISILDRLFTLDVDVFKDNRKDIFMTATRRNIPNYFGAAPVPANIGATETKGYEIIFGINKTWNNGFGFWFKEAISNARDIVTKGEDPELLYSYQKRVGLPINQTTNTQRLGFMNNWDDVYGSSPMPTNMTDRLPGSWDINDFNGDGVINSFDSAPIGYPTRPQKTYSTELGFNYKGIGLMFQFYGTKNITLPRHFIVPSLTRWVSVSENLRDYWTPQNTDAFFSAPRVAATNNYGDFYNEDGSYLRLKTVELSYTLPTNLIKPLGLTSSRIYVNGNNLLYWSDMESDIETGGRVAGNSYPMYKLINLGIDVKF